MDPPIPGNSCRWEVEGASVLGTLTLWGKPGAPLTSAVARCVRDRQGCTCENGAHASSDTGLPSRLHSSKAQGPRPGPSEAQRRFCWVTDVASLVSRTPLQPSLPPSDKLGQVGDFDVEITDVDVPRNVRQIDVFHSRHGPSGGCREATL